MPSHRHHTAIPKPAHRLASRVHAECIDSGLQQVIQPRPPAVIYAPSLSVSSSQRVPGSISRAAGPARTLLSFGPRMPRPSRADRHYVLDSVMTDGGVRSVGGASYRADPCHTRRYPALRPRGSRPRTPEPGRHRLVSGLTCHNAGNETRPGINLGTGTGTGSPPVRVKTSKTDPPCTSPC